MTRFLDPEDPFNPSHDLMRRWVGGLVEINDTVPDVLSERSLERRVTGGKRGVVSGSNIEAVVVFEEDRPLGSVNGGGEALGLDHVVGVVVLSGLGVHNLECLRGIYGVVVFGSVLLLLLLRPGHLDLRHGWARFCSTALPLCECELSVYYTKC